MDPCDLDRLAEEAEIESRLPLETLLRALRPETCLICRAQPPGQSRHGCRDRDAVPARIVVLAAGPGRELAVVPVRWAGGDAIGCTEWGELGLVRPAALAPDDRFWLASAEAHDCGLWIADGFDSPRARDVLGQAALVVAWHLPDVWPFVDGDARRCRPRPSRTVVDGRAPGYGRWPVPSVPWLSAWRLVVPGAGSGNGRTLAVPPMRKVFHDAGLPPHDDTVPALAQAIALASFLRRVAVCAAEFPTAASFPAAGGAPPVRLAFAGGRAYRCRGPDELEPLFAGGVDASQLRVFELLQAEAHLRLADQCVADASAAAP